MSSGRRYGGAEDEEKVVYMWFNIHVLHVLMLYTKQYYVCLNTSHV